MQKSYFLFLTIILIILTGCSHYFIDNQDTEDFKINHEWIDESEKQFDFNKAADFSFSGKTIYAAVKSGKASGTTLRNFLLSNLGRQNITGFEAQVKIVKNMNYTPHSQSWYKELKKYAEQQEKR